MVSSSTAVVSASVVSSVGSVVVIASVAGSVVAASSAPTVRPVVPNTLRAARIAGGVLFSYSGAIFERSRSPFH